MNIARELARGALLSRVRRGDEDGQEDRDEGHEDECGEPEPDGEGGGLVLHDCPVAGSEETECDEDGADSEDRGRGETHVRFASSQSSGVVISGSQP